MKRLLVTVHRWLGVVFCLLFLLWFPSGIGMMYWDYPGITDRDRQERSPNLDPSTIRLAADAAWATLGLNDPPSSVVLGSYAGRPVYRFTDSEGENVVYADTGEQQIDVTPGLMLKVAAEWAGQLPDAATVERVDAVDQWTLQVPFAELQPLWRYAWRLGDQVYVSAITGEVVQYTTTAGRIGAYLGPIPHWLYFTPLRKHGAAWSRVVIWTSALATLTALLGVAIGTWMLSPRRRYRIDGLPARVPYQGQKRWHMVLGLCFGVAAVTWGFSGMLSMDPFPAQGGAGTRVSAAAVSRALRGAPDLAAFGDRTPGQALSLVGALPAKEMELLTLAGEPAYIVTLADGSTRIVPVHGRPRDETNHERIADVVSAAVQPVGIAAFEATDRYDAYYLDRRGELPLPVLRVRLNDGDDTRYYIDPRTAEIVGGYSSRRWVTRWLYHALHSFDFPWLYAARPLWDAVVITFMLGGTALSVTSVILAWRLLVRSGRAEASAH
jgi:hypothetical protein